VSRAFGCLVDGVPLDAGQASVSVTDDGFLRGDGAFEVIRLYGGRPFARGDHLARLRNSAAALRLPCDWDLLEQEVSIACAQAAGQDCLLRIVLTRGARRVLLLERLPPLGDVVRLSVEAHSPTPLLHGVKTLSYAVNMHAARLAAERGFDDALLVRPEDSTVLEVSRSAFFWVSDGVVYAPPLSAGILDSITRRRIFQVEPVAERRIAAGDLAGVDEMFIADTVAEVLPVTEVEGIARIAGPGPATQRIQRAVRDVVAAELGRAQG
jgi:branched-chain amino acid aminotransferase